MSRRNRNRSQRQRAKKRKINNKIADDNKPNPTKQADATPPEISATEILVPTTIDIPIVDDQAETVSDMPESNTDNGQTQQTPEEQNRSIRLPVIIELCFSGCLVLFTFMQVIVAWLQWGTSENQNFIARVQSDIATTQSIIMEKQSQIMQNQIMQDQRAWFGITQIDNWDIKNGLGKSIIIKLKNTGNSPALKIFTSSAVFVSDNENVEIGDRMIDWLDKNPKISRNDKNIGVENGTIFPDQIMDHHTVPLETIKQIGEQEIISQKIFMFIIVFCSYEDIFGKPHYTQGCFAYEVSSGLFKIHTSGNYAD